MRWIKLIAILHKIKLLSPSALLKFSLSIWKYGINLMTLLHVSAAVHRERIALVDEQETLTYNQLLAHAQVLAAVFRRRHGIGPGMKVACLCRNHATFVKSIFALSSTGADVYFLHVEMSANQLKTVVERHKFQLILYDREFRGKIEQASCLNAAVETEQMQEWIQIYSGENEKSRRMGSGKLVLLTGGTTGRAKEAPHSPSLFRYLDAFFAFVDRLNIMNCHTSYIATPMYHGYGLAVMLLFCATGKTSVIRRGFDAEHACWLIQEHRVEVVTVVPLMLRSMLQTDAKALSSLVCIASGGSELHPALVQETRRRLGDVLYNLYGTSEAGLLTIAVPRDLAASPRTIGRSIPGVRIKIADEQGKEAAVGERGAFYVKTSRGGPWMQTGDAGYRDQEGRYYWLGRVDHMIISGGENVFPLEVEQMLLTHPSVEEAAVIGVEDERFGQRLKAYVVLTPGTNAAPDELMMWLRSRLARFQMPKEIEIVEELPYTPLGKLDKRALALREGE